jgi:hypothetical protein
MTGGEGVPDPPLARLSLALVERLCRAPERDRLLASQCPRALDARPRPPPQSSFPRRRESIAALACITEMRRCDGAGRSRLRSGHRPNRHSRAGGNPYAALAAKSPLVDCMRELGDPKRFPDPKRRSSVGVKKHRTAGNERHHGRARVARCRTPNPQGQLIQINAARSAIG